MRTKYSFATLAVAGVLLAGCGSSNPTSSSTASSAAPPASSSTTAASSTPASSTPASTAPPTSASGGTAAPSALAACQTAYNNSPLPVALKNKILSICKQALSGNVAGIKAEAKATCLQVVQTLPATEQALAKAECAKY